MNKSYIDVTERPDLYDWLYSDQIEDISMYLSLAEEHSEIVECGIGSGRITIPLAESDKTVYGIDNSSAMLKRLKDKLVHLPKAIQNRIYIYQYDMRNFDLGRKFSLVLVPFSTFNYLLTIEDQKSSLRAIRNHLTAQGTLVLELLSFSLFPNWLDNDSAMRKVAKRIDPDTGKTIEMWRVTRFDSATQIVEQDRHFRFYDANGVFEKEVVVLWRNRFFFIGEMQLLLEATGFEIATIYGDCNFGPYQHNSEFVVVIAKPKIK